jgi:hypothetical protein
VAVRQSYKSAQELGRVPNMGFSWRGKFGCLPGLSCNVRLVACSPWIEGSAVAATPIPMPVKSSGSRRATAVSTSAVVTMDPETPPMPCSHRLG